MREESPQPDSAPLRLAAGEPIDWTHETDVLIAGFGAAGAAAALGAHEGGARALVIDRYNLGGATARSGGVIYAGGGTPQQQRAGVHDTPEAMFRYLSHEVGDAVRPETLRRFCEESRAQLAWLESLGARFEGAPNPPKTSYPPNGVFLYYSGNEALAGYREDAEPAARGHRTVDRGLSGKALFAVLKGAVESRAIPVLGQCRVQRLIVDADGRVLGAECRQLPPGSPAARRHARLIRRVERLHLLAPGWAARVRARATELESQAGQTIRIRAAGGVVLATGGFIMNRRMVDEHAPAFNAAMRLGTSGCDGSGIRLGQSVGGATGQMHRVSAWRFINPPLPWVEGMAVNARGERFCNEASYGARLGVTMCEEHGGRAWLILDADQRRRALHHALTGGLWAFQSLPALLLMLLAPRAPSLAALAARLGLPADTLTATAATYNRAARGEITDPLGKDGAALRALTRPPYCAVDISAGNPRFPLPALTLGGLRVDESDGAVLSVDGQRIDGLYAAGRAAVGIASNRYVSGLSLADCLWSGRRAGRAAGAGDASARAA